MLDAESFKSLEPNRQCFVCGSAKVRAADYGMKFINPKSFLYMAHDIG